MPKLLHVAAERLLPLLQLLVSAEPRGNLGDFASDGLEGADLVVEVLFLVLQLGETPFEGVGVFL